MNGIKLGSFLIVFGETKISNFINFIFDKNVGRLEISVDDFVFVEIFVPMDNLLGDDQDLGFGKFFSVIEHILKRTPIAELLEQINIFGRFLNIIELHDVGILKSFHDINLVPKGIKKFLWVFFDVDCGDSLHSDEVSIADISTLIH